LPNLFRDLVAEGAMSSSIVPVLSSYRATKPPEEFWRLAQALAVRILVAVITLGVLGAVGAPWLVRLVAPGFLQEPEKFQLTVWLTRIIFPFIALVGLWAFFSGLLNSVHRFAAPALGPAVLNLIMIIGCVWIVPLTEPRILGLAWAVIVGGVVQLAIQLPHAYAMGFRWQWRWKHPGSAEVMRLLTPRMVGAAVYQVSVLFDTIVASIGALTGAGAVAALYFAHRLVQLPLALFATASAQASLPMLSERAAMQDFQTFRATILTVLRVVVFESLPAAVGLMVLAVPIVQVCFERGAFDHQSTLMTARTLSCFSVGLVAYSAGKVLAGAFYALRDTRTPVRLAIEALGINMVLALLLVGPLKIGGLALATALSSSFNAWRLLRRLEHRLQAPMIPLLIEPISRMGAAAAVMGAGCWLLWRLSSRLWPTLAALSLTIAGGIILYAVACWLFRVDELSRAFRWITTLRPQSRCSNA
jgi:putative peptidoglycan lipid II flippase